MPSDAGSGGVATAIARKLRLTVDAEPWARAAFSDASQLVERHGCRAVITTLSPFACWRVGAHLQKTCGLPWIVDLRDPWVLDGWFSWRTRMHLELHRRQMRHVLRTADAVVANTKEARKAFIELGAEPQKVVAIENGFDGSQFERLRDVPPSTPSTDTFDLVHVGTWHGADLPPGLTANRATRFYTRHIARLGRTGFYLLHALARLEPEFRDVVRVHAYGRREASHERLAQELGVEAQLAWHGYTSHDDAVVALLHADAVFVPLHGLPSGERALLTPGKLYEAIASERPVLAALPAGDGADLVRDTEAGVVVDPEDADEIADAIRALVAAWRNGSASLGARREAVSAYERRELTSKLAAVLDDLTRRR